MDKSYTEGDTHSTQLFSLQAWWSIKSAKLIDSVKRSTRVPNVFAGYLFIVMATFCDCILSSLRAIHIPREPLHAIKAIISLCILWSLQTPIMRSANKRATQKAKTMALRVVTFALLALRSHHVKCTRLTNYNLVSVEDTSWTTDNVRTQDTRGPM